MKIFFTLIFLVIVIFASISTRDYSKSDKFEPQEFVDMYVVKDSHNLRHGSVYISKESLLRHTQLTYSTDRYTRKMLSDRLTIFLNHGSKILRALMI